MIYEIVKGLSKLTTTSKKVLPDIVMLDFTIVKAYMVNLKNNTGWVLIDTGLENSFDFIKETAEEYYGKDSKPQAIILTHGHFDHVGSVISLSNLWDVKIYAHELEMPYLTGKKDYPKGDPTVDEGLVAKMSPAFPNEGIDLGDKITALNPDGSIPEMKEWRWIHTPGHTEGHISLFRDLDKVLIVGDAFTTTKQESLLSIITGRDDVKGPPAYLTTDWINAQRSINVLEKLQPSVALPSHGDLLKGEELSKHIQFLNEHFEEQAIPDKGKFVDL